MATKRAPRGERAWKSIEEVNSELEKKYGRKVLIKGSEMKNQTILRVSSGSLAQDIMLGGGWPLNHWNEIIGNPSSGKTSSIFQTLAEQIRVNPKYKILWVASEPFVAKWAELNGVPMSNIEAIAETAIMEEAYEIVIEYLDNRLVDAIVIDSFPALSPIGEEAAAFDEWQVGLGARLTGKFFRKASSAQKRDLVEEDRPCLLFVVNQWREKIGVMFGDPRTTPGGRAKDYFHFTRVEYSKDEWIVLDTTTKKRIGLKMRAHSLKNKTAPVERAATMSFYFDEGGPVPPGKYDEALDTYVCAVAAEVIEKAEKGGGHMFGDQVWRKKDDVILSLREDLDLRNLLRYEVLRSHGIDSDPPAKPKAPRQRRAPAAKPGTPAKAAGGKLWGNGK